MFELLKNLEPDKKIQIVYQLKRKIEFTELSIISSDSVIYEALAELETKRNKTFDEFNEDDKNISISEMYDWLDKTVLQSQKSSQNIEKARQTLQNLKLDEKPKDGGQVVNKVSLEITAKERKEKEVSLKEITPKQVNRTKESKLTENLDFIQRFAEICGSAEPTDIARFLNIPYQAAKNYLNGRMPDSNVLVIISERTPYSIHWLLTGQGRKFVESPKEEETFQMSDQLREFVKRECLELIDELLSSRTETAQSKVVVLTPDDIKEKIIKEDKPEAKPLINELTSLENAGFDFSISKKLKVSLIRQTWATGKPRR